MCFFVNFLDDASWDTSYNHIFRDILSNDRSSGNDCTVSNLNSFNHNSVGTDQDIVTDPNRLSRSWLNDSRKNGTRTDMAVFTNSSTTTKDSPHINHGSCTDFSTDIDDSPHHDYRIVFNRYLVTDNSAWFNTRI